MPECLDEAPARCLGADDDYLHAGKSPTETASMCGHCGAIGDNKRLSALVLYVRSLPMCLRPKLKVWQVNMGVASEYGRGK